MNKTLDVYIDNLFINISKTEVIVEIVNDLKVSTNDKYLDLIKEGLNENEAVGKIINEFGSVDEILKEMNYDDKIVYQKGNVTIKKTSIQEKFAAILMLLATITYLITGFIFSMWGTMCIVFPIAALLAGIINITKND